MSGNKPPRPASPAATQALYMKSPRRWFQYSLRSFLVLLTALAVWLGIVVNRAREQREAVKAIEALGGIVHYDWQKDPGYRGSYAQTLQPITWGGNGIPRNWVDQIAGDDLLHDVDGVVLRASKVVLRVNPETYGKQVVADFYGQGWSNAELCEMIQQLKRLPALSCVFIEYSPTLREPSVNKIRRALPHCDIVRVFPNEVGIRAGVTRVPARSARP